MKVTFLIFLTIIGFTLITINSCNKGDKLTPQTIDSIKSVLPKQIIWTTLGNFDSLVTEVISIKYDTLNRQIGLYFDDTTNTNPYDQLAVSYTYNSNGYLIKAIGFNGACPCFSNTTVAINRDVDNKIIYVATDDDYAGKDTVFYSYEFVSGGTNITMLRFNRTDPFFNDTALYQYNSNFQLMSINRSKSGNIIYKYNPNNTLDKIILPGSSFIFLEEDFFYPSGITTEQKDLLLDLFIGKDDYLPQLKVLYPFQFVEGTMYGETYGFNATNPYHISRVTATHPYLGPDEEANLTYEFNERNLLSKVTFTHNGQLSGMAIFRY